MATIIDPQIEEERIGLAKAGDADSFGYLYDTYIKQIYDFVFYKTMHQQLAEDITADVFMKAWKRIEQFRDGSFVAWLYVIARNSVIDHYRKDKELKDIDDCWDLSDGQDILFETDRSMQIEKLKEAMAALNGSDREILIMRFWQDLSFAEIAQCLAKEQGAVKMACARSIKKLQDKMPLVLFIMLAAIINIWKNIN